MKFIFTTVVAILLLCGCSNTSVSGGSTTVENPFVFCVVRDSENNPLDSISVSLYPEEYNPLFGDTEHVRTAFTDSMGVAMISDIPVESYSIIARGQSVGAFRSYLDLQNINSDTIAITVTPVTSLRVHADSGTEAVYFAGTPFQASFDTLTSVYTFSSLPAGNYPVLSIIGEKDTTKMIDIIVESDRELDLYTSGNMAEYYPVIPALNQQSGMNVISTGAMSDMVWFGTTDSGMWSVSNDSLGIQYSGGSSSFFNNSITAIEAHAEWKTSEKPINLLLASPEGTLHLEDSSGRYLERNEYPGVGGTFAQALHIDRSGRAWTAYDTVVCYTDESNEWSGRLTQSNVVAFAGDFDDTLFLGHADGTITGITSTDTFMLDILKKSMPTVILSDIALNGNGEIICGTSQGLYGVRTDNILSTTYTTSLDIRTVVIDSNGSIYGLHGEKSLVVAAGGGLRNYVDLFGDDVVIHDISLRGNNSLYVAAGVKGALRCDFVP